MQADGAEKAAAPASLKKSLYAVSSLADLLSTIRWLALDAEAEKTWEQDDTTIPAQLRAWLAMGAAILVAMTQEEVTELLTSVQPADAALALAASGELSKGAVQTLSKVAELTTERDALQKRVQELEARPAPAKGVVKVIDKADDTKPELADDLEKIDPNAPDFSLQVMKAAQRRGRLITPR